MYRDDMCTCRGGVECDSDKKWRKKHKLRKPAKLKVTLQEQLEKAEGKLAQAVLLNDKVRMKNYRAQVRMILGRIKKIEQVRDDKVVAVCEEESEQDKCGSESMVCVSTSS